MLVERTLGGLHAFLEEVVSNQFSQGIPSTIDLGCGTGAWLHRIRQSVEGRVVGIDYEKPVDIGNLDLRQFDINSDAPDSLGKYALVTCIEVIEHIENIGRLLDVVQASTDSLGMAIITTPNVESVRARVRALVSGKIPSFDEKSDPTHLVPILRDSLQKMLARRGMRIVETMQYPKDRRISRQYRRSVRWAALFGELMVPNPYYGDTAVHLVRHEN